MLIDSNIIIYAAKPENEALRQWIAEMAPAVSAVSYVEVLGYHKLEADDKKLLEEFFAAATLLPINHVRRRKNSRQSRYICHYSPPLGRETLQVGYLGEGISMASRDDDAIREGSLAAGRPGPLLSKETPADAIREGLPRPAASPLSPKDRADDDEDRQRKRRGGAIIPTGNGMALAACCCGLGALILILGNILAADRCPWVGPPFLALIFGGGGICALLGVIFGIVGLVKVQRNPEARGTTHAIIGIVFGVLMTGLAVLGLQFVLAGGVGR